MLASCFCLCFVAFQLLVIDALQHVVSVTFSLIYYEAASARPLLVMWYCQHRWILNSKTGKKWKNPQLLRADVELTKLYIR